MLCDNKRSGVVVAKVNDMFEELNVPLVSNNNIMKKDLGTKGLHLNQYEKAKLAMNYIAALKKL